VTSKQLYSPMRSLSDALQTVGCPPARLARKRRPRQVNCLDRSFYTIFLAIAMIGKGHLASHPRAQLSPEDVQVQ